MKKKFKKQTKIDGILFLYFPLTYESDSPKVTAKEILRMGNKSKDATIISFGDSIVRKSDLNLLSGPHWLNDRIISFYFEYLYEKEFESSTKLVFISPEVSQFLKMAQKEELGIFLEPLNLDEKDLIILAVNNSNDPERPGGSHWSLLMYSRQAHEFFHFDSSSGMNNDSARQLASKTHSYLMTKTNVEERFPLRIKEVPVVQQSNGYDCGVHLLCNAQYATRHLLIYGSDDGLDKLNEHTVKCKRSDLKRLILDLSGIEEEGES